jgi:hypothetical protein
MACARFGVSSGREGIVLVHSFETSHFASGGLSQAALVGADLGWRAIAVALGDPGAV